MFDRIAPRYDLLNRLLSGRQDVSWRRKLVRLLPERAKMRVLDLATGTGDVLVELWRADRGVERGIGMDMSGGMLALGRDKLVQRGLNGACRMVRGDAGQIAAADNSFDAVTIAFGIRNVIDVHEALKEMRRVLNPGGRALILEFSLPSNAIFRGVYLFYFRHVLPRIGGAISGDSHAYRYLNQTVETFPYGDAFLTLMRDAGFRDVCAHSLTFGIASIYQGDK